MKRWAPLLVVLSLVSFRLHAQQQQIYCQGSGTPSPIACNTGGPPAQSGTGDFGWLVGGKINAMMGQLFQLYPSSPPSQVPSNATILQDWPLSAAVEAFDYGCSAVVNTLFDATPCLQAAANAASATRNRTVHIPGGTYYIRTRWNCPSNGVILRGDGWNLTQSGVGTWMHVVTAQFQSGGPQQGNHPFQCGSSAAVNLFEASDIAFTEDQPADAVSWAPTPYAQGAMWIFANGSRVPRFIHVYFAGVNYAINFHSVQGYFLQGNSFQIYTTGVQVDHNSDWAHAALNTWQDTFCNTANCPNITAYSQSNAIGIQSNRNDNPSFVDNEGFGLFALLAQGTDATGVTTNLKLSHMDCDKCEHTVYNTAAGTSGSYDQLQGHTFNFAGSAALRGGDIFFDSGGTGDFDISNMRCQNSGDACINLTGSGDKVNIHGGHLFSWGQNSTANGTCDSTVNAINVGSSNVNTVRITNVTFEPGGCSTKIYAGSNTVSASNGQFAGWTPSLLLGGGNTGLTATQVGEYQVNDHSVEVQFVVSVSALGSSTGAATITGLPFTTNNSGNWGAAGLGGCGQATGLASMSGPIVLFAAANSSTLQLFQMGATGLGALTNSNLSSSTTLRCRFTYFQ